MNLGFDFFFTSIMLGVGLAMDAFSVSLANGLNEPKMKKHRMCGVAGIFSAFQFAMPMIGWICVSTIAQYFKAFEKCIPWIALGLLGFIGGKMLYEGIKNKDSGDDKPAVGFKATRIIDPTPINYNGMILFAVIGAVVNFLAAFFTRHGDSLNQRAVNLHMLEDVLGWIVVLVGAVVMKFTDFALIDPIMSIGVAVFIFINAFKNLKEVTDLFLEKKPHGIDVKEIQEHITEIDGVIDVHHIHVWSMDGVNHYATIHIVTNEDGHIIKEKVREELKKHGIGHVTLELEEEGEHCHDQHCHTEAIPTGHHHHHQHHHH